MQQAGSITIMAHDEPAAQLLSCLREHVRELKVGIAEPDGNHVWVTDHSGSVASLPDLLEERLDQCEQATDHEDSVHLPFAALGGRETESLTDCVRVKNRDGERESASEVHHERP